MMLTLAHSAVHEQLRFPLLPSLPLPLLGLYQLTPPQMGDTAGFTYQPQQAPSTPSGTFIRQHPSQNSYSTPPHGPSQHGPYGSHDTSQSGHYNTPQYRPHNANGPPPSGPLLSGPPPSSAASSQAAVHPHGPTPSHGEASNRSPQVDLNASVGTPGDMDQGGARAGTIPNMSIFVDNILNLWGFGPKEAAMRKYMHGFIKASYLHRFNRLLLMFSGLDGGNP